MDDRVLPLDMTIYGAIHQHEARRQPPVHPSNLWSGQYSVKYKKVSGPPPTVQGEWHNQRGILPRAY